MGMRARSLLGAAGVVCWAACGSTVTFVGGSEHSTGSGIGGGSGGSTNQSGTAATTPASSSSGSVTCSFGTADCDGIPANGCEQSTLDDPANCGGCNALCPSGPNGKAACAKGTCQLACDPGFGNCDGGDKNGCESLLDSDPKNCGGCNKSCAATCAGGLCLLQKPIAKGLNHPASIAVDSASVYWAELGSAPAFADGAIKQMPKDLSGAPATLVSKLQTPASLIIVSDTLYWTTEGSAAASYSDGTVQALKFGNPAPIVLATAQQLPTSVVVSNNTVYWTNAGSAPNYNDGAVMSLTMAPNAKPVTVIAGQLYPVRIAVQDNTIYWLSAGTAKMSYGDGSLWSLPIGKAPPAKQLTAQLKGALHFSADLGKYLFVSETLAAQVTQLVYDGSMKKPLYSTGKLLPYALTLGAGGIYNTAIPQNNGAGAIQRADFNGNVVTLYPTASNAYGIVNSKADIYWTEIGDLKKNMSDGVVMVAPQ